MIERIRPLWFRRIVLAALTPLIVALFILWHGAENLGQFGPGYRELWRGDAR